MSNDIENELRRARAEALIESTRSLLLLNGGAVIAVATWLQAVWEKGWASGMLRPMIYAAMFLSAGALSAAMCPFFRYKAGYSALQTNVIENAWWRWNQYLTWASMILFVVGMAIVLLAALCAVP